MLPSPDRLFRLTSSASGDSGTYPNSNAILFGSIGGVPHYMTLMNFNVATLRALLPPLALCLLGGDQVIGSPVVGAPSSAMATLSRRAAKPGERVELVLTVHNARHPVIESIERPSSFRLHALRKPQLLHAGDGDVWLFRYKIVPKETGDFEIPPIRLRDGSLTMMTKPMHLHVSKRGELPALTPSELEIGVNIPTALSEEVIRSAPQPPPKPEPIPTPRDTRMLPARATTTLLKEMKAFWNYPGAK